MFLIYLYACVGGREVRFQRTADAAGHAQPRHCREALRVLGYGVGHIRRGTPRMATGRSRTWL
jgi:hypothetical protein